MKRQVGELFPIFTHLQSQPASFPPLAKGWREKTAHNSPNKALNKFAPTLHSHSLLVYLFVRLFLVARKYSPCLFLGCVVRGIKGGEEIRGFAVSLGITKKTNGKGMCVTPENIFAGKKGFDIRHFSVPPLLGKSFFWLGHFYISNTCGIYKYVLRAFQTSTARV